MNLYGVTILLIHNPSFYIEEINMQPQNSLEEVSDPKPITKIIWKNPTTQSQSEKSM